MCAHTYTHIYFQSPIFYNRKNKYIWGTRTDMQIDSQQQRWSPPISSSNPTNCLFGEGEWGVQQCFHYLLSSIKTTAVFQNKQEKRLFCIRIHQGNSTREAQMALIRDIGKLPFSSLFQCLCDLGLKNHIPTPYQSQLGIEILITG